LLKDQVLEWVQQFAGLADKENWNFFGQIKLLVVMKNESMWE